MDVALLPLLLALKRLLELDGACNGAETEDHVSELEVTLAPPNAIKNRLLSNLLQCSDCHPQSLRVSFL